MEFNFMEMKRIAILSTLLVLLVSLTGKGQSTYLLPYRGATQTYNALASGASNPVRWYVATDILGATKAVHGVDYEFVPATGFNTTTNQYEATGDYSVDIKWGTGITEGSTYYVFVEVDDAVTHCTNRLALGVTISANFNAIVADVTGATTPGTVDPATVPPSSCPGDVINPVWDGDSHTNIGYTDLVYRVNRQYSLLAWQFEYRITEGASQTFNVQNVRVVNASGAEIYSGTNTTGTINLASTQEYALVYVRVTNQQGVTLDINMDLLTASNNTKDADDNLDSVSTDNSADHTIDPMPAINGFGGN